MRYESKVRGGAAAVLGLVLLAGVALGVAMDRTMFSQEAINAADPSSSTTQSAEPPNEWVIDRLDLSDAQRASVDSVVTHYGIQMSAFQKEFRPRYRAIVDSTTRALKALLDPDQQVRYDSLERRSREWRERNRTEAAGQ